MFFKAWCYFYRDKNICRRAPVQHLVFSPLIIPLQQSTKATFYSRAEIEATRFKEPSWMSWGGGVGGVTSGENKRLRSAYVRWCRGLRTIQLFFSNSGQYLTQLKQVLLLPVLMTQQRTCRDLRTPPSPGLSAGSCQSGLVSSAPDPAGCWASSRATALLSA